MMKTDFDEVADLRTQRELLIEQIKIATDQLSAKTESQSSQLMSKIEIKLSRQTTQLIVWMFAMALGTLVCTVGLTSVLLKLSLG